MIDDITDDAYAAESDAIAKDAAALRMIQTDPVEICLYLEQDKDFMEGGMGESLSPARARLLARAKEHLGIRDKEAPRRARPSALSALINVAVSGAADNTRVRIADLSGARLAKVERALAAYGPARHLNSAGRAHVANKALAYLAKGHDHPNDAAYAVASATDARLIDIRESPCLTCCSSGICEPAGVEPHTCRDCNGHGTTAA